MDICLLFSLKWKTFNCHIFYSFPKNYFLLFPSSLKFFFIWFGFPFLFCSFFFFCHHIITVGEWRQKKKFFRFLWFVNSTLVCLIIARFKVKIYANFTRGKSRLLRGKRMKNFFFLVSNAKKLGIHSLARKWNEIEEDSLRVNLLNKITIIYSIFEGFFFLFLRSFDMF